MISQCVLRCFTLDKRERKARGLTHDAENQLWSVECGLRSSSTAVEAAKRMSLERDICLRGL